MPERLLKNYRLHLAASFLSLKLHLKRRLVSEYKEKNFVYYEINTTVFDELIIWVNQFGGKKV